MNKKILGISVSLFVMFLLVTPVMANGPVIAEPKNDNPNVEIVDSIYGFQMLVQTLPSGVILRWIYFENALVHTKVKFVTEFSNPELLDVGDNYLMWLTNPDYRQKWVKMNKGVYAPLGHPDSAGYLGLFATFGFPEPECPDEGVYIWGKETSLS